MSGEAPLCTLEVRGAPGDCTRRTFSAVSLPRTLSELFDMLRAQDLRLQSGSFALSIRRDGDGCDCPLQSDADVGRSLARPPLPRRLTFIVSLNSASALMANSMLADEGLVQLRIHHHPPFVASEKRFIAPRRGVRTALVKSVRDSVTHPPPPHVPMQLFAGDPTEGEISPINDEAAAIALLRVCAMRGAVCELAYRFPDADLEAATGAKASASLSALPELMLVGHSPVTPTPLSHTSNEAPRRTSSGDKDSGGDVFCAREKNSLRGDRGGGTRPSSFRVRRLQYASLRASVENPPCVVGGFSEPEALSSLTPIPDACAAAKAGPHVEAEVRTPPPPSPTATAHVGTACVAMHHTDSAKTRPAADSNGGDFVAAAECLAAADFVELRVDCAVTGAEVPVTLRLPWSRGCDGVCRVVRTRCAAALQLRHWSDAYLCDGGGRPIRGDYELHGYITETLRDARGGDVVPSVVSLLAFAVHPCTPHVPLQCDVKWGGKEVVLSCAVRREAPLSDLRRAILDELSVAGRAAADVWVSIDAGEDAPPRRLTEENALELLRDDPLPQLLVFSRRSSPPRALPPRTLRAAAAAVALEVALALGDAFHAVDAASLVERAASIAPHPPLSATGAAFLSMAAAAVVARAARHEAALCEALCETAAAVVPSEAEREGEAKSPEALGALAAMSRAVASARLAATARPTGAVGRFFRRAQRALRSAPAGGGEAAARHVRLAGADFAPAGCAGYAEVLARLHEADAFAAQRAVVAGRLAGESVLASRAPLAGAEQSALHDALRHELRHALDGVRAAAVGEFVRARSLRAAAPFASLLDAVGALLATSRAARCRHWLAESFTPDALLAKLRGFDDSAVATPRLGEICWELLRPEMHHIALLAESPVASALAAWAYTAAQLVCVRRQLEFPPVPMVDLCAYTRVVRGDGEGHETPSPHPAPPLAVAGKRTKMQFKYSYLCRDLRRDSRLPHPVR